QMWQGTVAAYGGSQNDFSTSWDGMRSDFPGGTGSTTGVYYDAGAVQEYVVQTNAGSAETQTGGVNINMIPRVGGNMFSGSLVVFGANSAMQSDNLTDDLKKQGVSASNGLVRTFDYNGSLGGPIRRNELWFFVSGRAWTYDRYQFGMVHDGKLGPVG